MTQHLFFVLAAFFSIHFASAGQITRISKNKRVIISLDEQVFKKGDIVYAVDGKDKKRAKLKILRVKGLKAMARIIKGRAKKGYQIQARQKEKAPKKQNPLREKEPAKPSSTKWAGLLGFSMDSTNFVVGSSKFSLSGNGYSMKFMLHSPLLDWAHLRFLTGLQTLSASSNCSNCKVEFTFFTLDFYATYPLTKSAWLGAGYGFFSAIQENKDSPLNQPGAQGVVLLATGYDLELSENSLVPIQLDYDLFPSSSESNASQLSMRIGYGSHF